MPDRSPVAQVVRRLARRPDAGAAADEGGQDAPPRSIGVIFVHGIGNQPTRETLLHWANSMIEMLTAWRREFDQGSAAHPVIGEDPVEKAAIEQVGGVDERAWVRIGIPSTDPEHPATTWLLTEAYWAGEIRAPDFAQALRYLQRHIAAIIRGIAAGYGLRERRREQRIAAIIDEQATPWDPRVAAEISELRRSASIRWRWIDWFDELWQWPLVRGVLSAVATTTSVIALALYAPLRAVPIKAIRDRAELASMDAQLVSAFGDLPVLLDDPVQAAIVRARLAEAIRWTRDRGCDEVVLVAHSGGAIVSYATLLDEVYRDLPVAKLVTLGQGLALGWRLEATTGPFVAGNPIRGDLGEARPLLRWVDFWASYDPAPAGQLAAVNGCPLVSVETVEPSKPVSPIQVESRPITNYMHMGQDHDGYWRNDEGFLIPLIRHIDDPRGDGSRSRFYASRLGRAVRIERRRRRVGLLFGWRRLSFGTGLASVLLGLAPGVTPGTSLATTGDGVAVVWSRIPGHELISGAIDGFGGTVALGLEAVGLHGLSLWLAWSGPWVLGALVPLVATYLVYSRGVGSWTTADAAERQEIRKERFGPAGQAWARSEAMLLVGGLIGIIIASMGAPIGLLVGWIVGVALVAFVVRQS